MALPTFQAKGTIDSRNLSGNIDPDWPTHAAGDIGLLIVESTGGQTPSLVTANGFELLDQVATGATTSGTRLQVYWCRATSASMSAPVISNPGNHVMGIIVTFRGCIAAGKPFDAYATSVHASAVTTTTWDAITTRTNDCLIVNIATRDNDSAAAAWSSESNASLSDLTERMDEGATNGNGGGFCLFEGGLAALGSSGATTATSTSSIQAKMTLALLPTTFVDTGWDEPLTLTVDNTKVDADFTDFPVYVNLADMPSAFWDNVQADGGDIRVTTSAGITCAVEVVSIDTGGDTGRLHFKAPSLANSTDTEFFVYVGHATAEQPAADHVHGSQAVWSNGYKGVWHLEQDPSGGAPQMTDSTSNANHGTTGGTMTSGDLVAAKIGNGLDLDGSDDYYRVSNNIGDDFTLQAWIKSSMTFPTTDFAWGGTGIIWSDVAFDNSDFVLAGTRTGTTDRLTFQVGNTETHLHGSVDITTGNWVHIAATRVKSSGAKEIFVNGASGGTQTGGTASLTANANIDIGGNTLDSRYFTGQMDEVRISNVARSSAWIATEYNNQNSPSTFYSITGAVETASVSPVPVSVTVPAVTATAKFTAAVAAVLVSLTPVATTATYAQINAASVAPQGISVTVPAVTAVPIHHATVAPVPVTVTPQAVTATYQAHLTAGVAPVPVSVSVPAVTAVNRATASVSPVAVSVAPAAVTAVAAVIVEAEAAPVGISVTVPAVTAVNRAFASISPVGVSVAPQAVTGAYHISASVAPASLAISVPSVTATYIQVETATAGPASITVSPQNVTAVNRATASVAQTGVSVIPASVTATYVQVETAGAAPAAVSVAVPSVTAVNHAFGQAAPVGVAVAVPPVTASYVEPRTADAAPLGVRVTVVSVSATHRSAASADPVGLTVSVPSVSAAAVLAVQASVDPVGIRVSVPEVVSTGTVPEFAALSIKDALYRELRYGGHLGGMPVYLDARTDLDDEYPCVIFRRITSTEDNKIRYARERIEMELVGGPEHADDLEAYQEALIDEFAGRMKTWGKFTAAGASSDLFGLKMKCLHVDTVQLYEHETDELVYILIFIFYYVRGEV